MPGLHECPHCHYRFENKEALDAHLTDGCPEVKDLTDPLNDPRFPDRPGHQDFWRLVSAVNYLDGEALEGGRTAPDILAQYVDAESLAYIANQRFMRAVVAANDDLSFQNITLALYTDAFALGCQYTRERKDDG